MPASLLSAPQLSALTDQMESLRQTVAKKANVSDVENLVSVLISGQVALLLLVSCFSRSSALLGLRLSFHFSVCSFLLSFLYFMIALLRILLDLFLSSIHMSLHSSSFSPIIDLLPSVFFFLVSPSFVFMSSSSSSGDYAVLAGKHVEAWRCLSCNRPMLRPAGV